MRVVPRAGAGAHGSGRRQGYDLDSLRKGFAEFGCRTKPGLRAVPCARHAPVLERQPARVARHGLRGLPPSEAGYTSGALFRRALQRSALGKPGSKKVAAGVVPAMPPDAARAIAALVAHALSRR